MRKAILVFALALVPCAVAAAPGVAYVSQTGGEPWGMMGNVNALDDVFGSWDRLDFPTAVQNGLWSYQFILLDGGDGAQPEFDAFVNANRADMEQWVSNGGRLIINAARWGGEVLDLGFGATLIPDTTSEMGFATDVNHPIFDGPYGQTGDTFMGNSFSHDILNGDLKPLMKGETGEMILGEKAFGSGWVIAGGLTLPFFGEHELWSDNCAPFHRNLLDYAYKVPEPASFALFGLALLALRRR